ncbi:MAG TPA: PQQ-dependent sugar dehydrogenase [Vicinamibacterales bacterium]
MRRLSILSAVIAVAVAGLMPLVYAQRPENPREISRLYGQLCASCHGQNLAGGMAQSLLDDEWKFGGDDESLAKSIREGHPEAGMPPMGNALSEQEIRAMVIYIREEATKARRAATTFNQPEGDREVQSELHAFRLETVADGLEIPWGIDFLPDGRMLVSEKPGRLRVIENGMLLPEPVGGVPEVWSGGQGGLLDIGVHPDYASNGWIYLSYSDPGPDGSAMTAVVRGRLKDGQFVDQQQIFKAPVELYRTGRVHFGSRFVFDNGYLFFSIGERGQQKDAQDLSRPNGKVHRLFDDGRVPPDNPFVGKADALPSIWSYGHRNPQGLAKHPVTGALYDAEHGPRGGDELNLVQKGRNYGWPLITYGMNYDGTPITNQTAAPGLEQPVTYWVPSIAVSSIAFYTGDKFPKWKHNLFVGALAQQELRRLVLEDGKVTHQEVLFKNIGRVRDVVNGPDGYIYVTFDSGRVARLVPSAGTK